MKARFGNPHAWPGILSVTIGTVVAVALVPEAFWTPGALFTSGLSLSLGLLLPIVWVAVKRPIEVFWTEHLLCVGLVFWLLLDLIQRVNEPTGVSRDSVLLAFTAIGLFAVGIWLGVSFRPWPLPRLVADSAAVDLPSGAVFGASVGCFLLTMANYLIAADFDIVRVFGDLGRPRWSEAWSISRLGGWSAFREHLVYFGYLVPTLTVLLARQVGWWDTRTLLSGVMALLVLAFASQTGTRGEVGVIAGAALICWLFLRARITAGTVLKLALGAAVLLGWMQLMLLYRNRGLEKIFAEEVVPQQLEYKYLVVDDNFFRLCQVLDAIPERIDHTYGGQLFYVLVRPIPRAIWPDKPVGPGFVFEDAVGAKGMTLAVSAIGEFYYDFGLPFILIGGFLYGRLAGMWNQLLFRRQGAMWPVLYGLGAMALFIGVRSQQALLVRVYPILAWLVLYYLIFIGRRRRRRPTRISKGLPVQATAPVAPAL